MIKNFSIIINIIFTVAVASIVIVICLEASNIFNKTKTEAIILSSNFINHKAEYKDNKSDYKPYSVTNSGDFKGYDTKPQKNIQNIINHDEIPNYHLNIEQEIQINPLFRGYYAQLGIFGTKKAVDEVVNIISLKGILQEKFTTYIEEKEINDKSVYLLEIGVFAEKHEVLEFCTKLSKINIGCVLVEEY